MVTTEVYRDFSSVQDSFENMELQVLAPAGVILAGGVFLARAGVENLFPEIGLNADPSTIKDLGAAAVFKVAVAIGLVMAAGFVGDRFASLAAVLGVGILASSGADLWELVGDVSDEATSQMTSSNTRSRNTRSRNTRSRPRQARPSTGGGRSRGSGRATADRNRASTPRSRKREAKNWG